MKVKFDWRLRMHSIIHCNFFSEKPTQQKNCVNNQNEWQEAVNNYSNVMAGKSCTIDVCPVRLFLDNSSVNGINLSNQNIVSNCQKSCPKMRCIIDGQGVSRMFYGSRCNLTFQNFILTNGFHRYEGGSIKEENNSLVSIVNCSFVNNTAPYGSAIIVNQSSLMINGVETSFVNNTGVGPPIQGFSSLVNISNAVFSDNNVSTKFSSAILLFQSTIEVSDVHILKSAVTQLQSNMSTNINVYDDCDIYMSLFMLMNLVKSRHVFS
jgi:hypothetical protein